MPRPIVLLDVDHTLILGDNSVNQALLNALKAQGILDTYLFTDMTLNRSQIEERNELLATMRSQGFAVHGVMTPSDITWNILNAAGRKISNDVIAREAITLYHDLYDATSDFNTNITEDPLRIMPALPTDIDTLLSYTGSYVLAEEKEKALYYIETDGSRHSIAIDLNQFQQDIAKEKSKSSDMSGALSARTIKNLISKNWGYVQSWITRTDLEGTPAYPAMSAAMRIGYNPIAQQPGEAFRAANEAVTSTPQAQEGIAARGQIAKMYADVLSTPNYEHVKGMMLDLFISQQPKWVSSIIVIDDHPKVASTIAAFRPVSLHTTDSHATVSMMPIDKTARPNQAQYEASLKGHLAKDLTVQICTAIDAHIATLAGKTSLFLRSPQEKIAALENLKQYVKTYAAEAAIDQNFTEILKRWKAEHPEYNAKIASHRNTFAQTERPGVLTSSQLLLQELQVKYGSTPLDRAVPQSRSTATLYTPTTSLLSTSITTKPTTASPTA